LKKFYLLICFVFLLFNANSQFTYINASGGYEGLSLNSNPGKTLTGLKSITTSVSVISRFKRHFGVGAKFSIPVNQKFEFSFRNSETYLNGIFTDDYITNPTSRYYAQEYDYNVDYKNIISLFGRVYFDKYVNFYSDISISFLKMNESFSFYRAYVPPVFGDYSVDFKPSIPEQSFEFDKEYTLFSPGLRIGLSPHITDNIYIDFNFGWDLLFFGEKNFEFSTPFEYSYGSNNKPPNVVKLESQASGTKALFSTNLGVGFYF